MSESRIKDLRAEVRDGKYINSGNSLTETAYEQKREQIAAYEKWAVENCHMTYSRAKTSDKPRNIRLKPFAAS